MLMGHIVTAIGSMLILTLYPDCPTYSPCELVTITGLGLFSISNSLWKIIYVLISLVVDEKFHGTAYGLMSCVQNFSLVVSPMLIGFIHDRTEDDYYFGYFWVGVFYMGMGACSFLLLCCIIKYDYVKYGRILNKLTQD